MFYIYISVRVYVYMVFVCVCTLILQIKAYTAPPSQNYSSGSFFGPAMPARQDTCNCTFHKKWR